MRSITLTFLTAAVLAVGPAAASAQDSTDQIPVPEPILTKLGHTPTVQEIAVRIEASDEEVLEAMHAAQGHHAVSLDATSRMRSCTSRGTWTDQPRSRKCRLISPEIVGTA